MKNEMIDVFNFGILIFDLETGFINDVNRAFLKLTGISKKKVLGEKIIHLFSQTDIARLQEQKSNEQIETELIGDKGKKLFVLAEFSQTKEKTGMISLANITTLRQKFNWIKEERDGMRQFFENIPVAAYRNTGGPTGKFLLGNPA
ncbi:MAG: PAS domain-containing protein, partial [Desulfobacteraceae bacterium]|nr:PAS domain-containing protein [Desulfobacteraceae bacterium]